MRESKKERNLKEFGGRWYLDFTFKGKRIRQFGGYTKDQARNVLAKLRIEKLDEKLGFKKPNGEAILFETFAKEYLELYAKQNKRSWARDEISLENLKRSFRGKSLRDIGPEDAERYKAKRKAQVSPATVNRELACLKTLFNKAVEWGKIETSPIKAVKKFKENNVKERILSASEVGRLLEAAGPEIRPVLITALNTGMRRGEILSLKWEDVNFVKGFILIENSKSGRSRKVPMNNLVIETLRAVPRVAEHVFFNPETKTHIKDVKTGFKSACSRAKEKPDDKKDPGIVGVRFHDLRHTAASKMIEAGVDLVTVSKILGHSSIQMTMRYAHPTPENMRLAVEKLGAMLDPTRQKVDSVIYRPSVSYLNKAH